MIAATGLLPSQLSPAAPVEDSVKNIQLHKKDDNKVEQSCVVIGRCPYYKMKCLTVWRGSTVL